MASSPFALRADIQSLRLTDAAVLLGAVWVLTKLIRRVIASRSATKGTRLRAPPRASLLFGVSPILTRADEPAIVFDDWARTYGAVFEIPTPFGGRRVILTDPRAVNHFYASERAVYVKPAMTRRVIGNIFGHGLLWAEGDDHKRQRKALTPAFSNAAIRQLTQVFYNSAHKLEGHWDAKLEKSPEGVVLDVEAWMNRVALDSIGIAGFGHDFHSLDGEPSAVADAFDSMAINGGRANTLNFLVFMLGTQIPLLAEAPTPRNVLFKKLRNILSGIADSLMEESRKEKEAEGSSESAADRSIIGLLLKAERDDAELHMNKTEITAQMNVLLLAGYETTSISLTWALIELCRNLQLQEKLRAELRAFGPQDPTWDQLTGTALPFLDGVVLETLRLHPALPDTTRQAQVDDIIPLSEPVVTATGETVDRITVPKDTVVTVSIRYMNRSAALWGADAAEFNPERWAALDSPSSSQRAKEIQGHRHLITFLDGPRTCLGKNFALAEFKAVLSVLVRNYTFEFAGVEGKDTGIKTVLGLIRRPAVEGQEGPIVPLRIKRVEA
ncbi:hypothetical protein HMN09_01235900 [Mycena chlorophos]|uniref:Cytochrome P450 n=1 Tax=Mycena chlorophos TaxID=658473 RepID=A0A8H6S305_MYCCL|nr:hypothetical protein HMN09_01235900 [Mycena chlorophos]